MNNDRDPRNKPLSLGDTEPRILRRKFRETENFDFDLAVCQDRL